MIVIVAKSVVKKDKIDEFKKIAEPLIDSSRKEAGNIEYALYEDIANSNVLTFVEKWKDQPSIEIHSSSDHFTKTIPQLEALCEAPLEVTFYKAV